MTRWRRWAVLGVPFLLVLFGVGPASSEEGLIQRAEVRDGAVRVSLAEVELLGVLVDDPGPPPRLVGAVVGHGELRVALDECPRADHLADGGAAAFVADGLGGFIG